MSKSTADPGVPASLKGSGPVLREADQNLVARGIADAIPPTGFPIEPVARREAIDLAAAALAERLSSDEDLSGDRP